MVRFANELHVAVLDAVVHHFHVMAGAVRSDIGAAGLAVYLRGNGGEDRFNEPVGRFLAAGHDRRTFQRAFFAARHAGADEADAFRFKLAAAALRIRVMRVAAVDNDVAFVQMRHAAR